MHIPGQEDITWTPDDDKAVAKATEAFQMARSQGMMASTVTADPKGKVDGEVISSFTPEAETITFHRAYAGG